MADPGGHMTHDQRIEAFADSLLPPRHGSDVHLHRPIPISLGNLRITTGKQSHQIGCFSSGLHLRTHGYLSKSPSHHPSNQVHG